VSLEIRVARATGNRIVEDHLDGGASIRAFLAYDPHSAASYERRAEDIDRRFPDGYAHLVGALEPASQEGSTRLRAVVEERGFLVTTGHQAGLFGGPLMGVYKLLSAVRLARDLEESLGRPVAPAFWVAADDHDWDEARRTYLLDTSNDLVELALPADPAGAPTPPMSDRRLGPEVEPLLARLEDILPATEFAPDLLASVREAYTPQATVAGAFARLIGDLAGRFGVLLVDPAAEAVRALAAPVLRAALDGAEAHETSFRERSSALEEAGYHAQIPVLAGGTNLHFAGPLGRERIFRDDGGFRLRASGTAMTLGELRAASDTPGALTAGAGLRPVLESALLPTLAYVGGPAEVAYFAQIEPLFSEFGMTPPVVVPRFSVTLVEGKIRKVLDRFGLEPDAFDRPAHEIAARVLREELPEHVQSALRALRGALGEGYGRLAQAAREIDPTLDGAIGSARNAALKATEDLEKRIAQHSGGQRDIGLQQLRKAEANLVPTGKTQERVLNPLQYLVRYGATLLDDVLAAMGDTFATVH